jgi:hypothetical protein
VLTQTNDFCEKKGTKVARFSGVFFSSEIFIFRQLLQAGCPNKHDS